MLHADSVNALYDSLVSIKQESSGVFVRRAIWFEAHVAENNATVYIQMKL